MLSRYALVITSVIFLSACGGSSNGGTSGTSDNNNNRGQNQSTTAEIIEPNPESDIEKDTENNPPEKAQIDITYNRPADYPSYHMIPPQYIPTTSGHQMAVRVTLPAHGDGSPAEGPFPVILVQSGYNTGLFSTIQAPGGVLLGSPDPYMIKRGYAMVVADVLGTGVSEGGWEMIGAEEQSGYGDLVDWIQQQDWADGNIGVSGASYMAITSLFTAQQRPDDIKAVFASVPLGDAQRGTVGSGGLLNGVFMGEWMVLTHITATQNIPNILLNLDLMDEMMYATKQHIAQIDDYYLPIIEKAINGDPELTYDSEFWRTRSPIENMDQIKAPTIILGALDDIFQRDAPLLYEAIKDRVDSRLMLYDGSHLENFLQAIPGTNKIDPILHLQLQWFDKYLKGMDTGTENIPPVTQYVKNYGAGPWQGFITTTDWPHPQSEPERWYLRGDGGLTRQQPETMEFTRSMETPEFASYNYGKSDGILILDVIPNDGTTCSPSYVQWTLGMAGIVNPQRCHHDNRVLEQDALNYETAPMEEDYFISGPLQADLWISSTTTDAVVAVRIDEVTPRGKVIPITVGLLLASVRKVDESRSRYVFGEMVQPYHYLTQDQETLLIPNEITKLQVEIFPTSALIRKGNRLRISLSPSNQAQGMLNLIRRDRVAGGITSIHSSPEHPSSLVLLNVPREALN